MSGNHQTACNRGKPYGCSHQVFLSPLKEFFLQKRRNFLASFII